MHVGNVFPVTNVLYFYIVQSGIVEKTLKPQGEHVWEMFLPVINVL